MIKIQLWKFNLLYETTFLLYPLLIFTIWGHLIHSYLLHLAQQLISQHKNDQEAQIYFLRHIFFPSQYQLKLFVNHIFWDDWQIYKNLPIHTTHIEFLLGCVHHISIVNSLSDFFSIFWIEKSFWTILLKSEMLKKEYTYL